MAFRPPLKPQSSTRGSVNNQIPWPEWFARVEAFYKAIPHGGRAEAHQITEMFNLWNDKFLPRESGRSCSSCRARVYKNLKINFEAEKSKQFVNSTIGSVINKLKP